MYFVTVGLDSIVVRLILRIVMSSLKYCILTCCFLFNVTTFFFRIYHPKINNTGKLLNRNCGKVLIQIIHLKTKLKLLYYTGTFIFMINTLKK